MAQQLTSQLSKYNRRQFYNIRIRPRTRGGDGQEMLDFLSLRWIKFADKLNREQVTVHVVKEYEVGRLWAISQIYYRDDTLDWILAIVNNILDPIGGMSIGQKLAIPSLSTINEFYTSVQSSRRLDRVAELTRVIF